MAGLHVDGVSGRDALLYEHPKLRGEVLAQHHTGVEFPFANILRADAELLQPLDRLRAEPFDEALAMGGSSMLAMLASIARSFAAG